jgi:hypothetical protein
VLSEVDKQFDAKVSDFKDNINELFSKIKSLEKIGDGVD